MSWNRCCDPPTLLALSPYPDDSGEWWCPICGSRWETVDGIGFLQIKPGRSEPPDLKGILP